MARRLTDDEKNRVKAAIAQGRSAETVLYQTPDYNPAIKARDTRTGAVGTSNALGDAAHLLTFGITLGGLAHMAVRDSGQESKWKELVDNATDRAIDNRLSCFNDNPCTQLAIVGGKYITLYEKGEYKKRIIEFKDVVQICFGPKGLTFITRDNSAVGKYLAYIIFAKVQNLEALALMGVENSLRAFM